MKSKIPQHAIFSRQALKRLIVPLVIEQVLTVLVGMTDVIMVSSVGEAAVSGVSLVDMINQLIIALFTALATGGAVVSAQLIGAKEPERACKSAQQLLLVVGIFSAIMMAAAILLHVPLLRLLFGTVEPDVMRNAQIYFVLSAVSYPAIGFYSAGAALFRAQGNSRVSMLVSALSNGINIGGDALMIYGFHQGAAGAAIASLAARVVSAVLILILLANPKHAVTFRKGGRFAPDMGLIGRILGIGVPNGIENSMFHLGRILVLTVITACGTTQIAANAVANNFASLGSLPGQAIGYAMITVIGQCVGAKDYEQVRYYAKKLMQIAYLATGGLNALILLTLPLFMKIYQLSPETNHLAMILVWIHAGFSILIWPMSFALPNVLRAANDARFAMIVSSASMWLCRCVLGFFLGKYMGFGAIGVWSAMVVDWVFRSSMFLWRYCHEKWIPECYRTTRKA